jgi:hypothetical protein
MVRSSQLILTLEGFIRSLERPHPRTRRHRISSGLNLKFSTLNCLPRRQPRTVRRSFPFWNSALSVSTTHRVALSLTTYHSSLAIAFSATHERPQTQSLQPLAHTFRHQGVGGCSLGLLCARCVSVLSSLLAFAVNYQLSTVNLLRDPHPPVFLQRISIQRS